MHVEVRLDGAEVSGVSNYVSWGRPPVVFACARSGWSLALWVLREFFFKVMKEGSGTRDVLRGLSVSGVGNYFVSDDFFGCGEGDGGKG